MSLFIDDETAFGRRRLRADADADATTTGGAFWDNSDDDDDDEDHGPSTSTKYRSISRVVVLAARIFCIWILLISHSPRIGSFEPGGGSASYNIAFDEINTKRPSFQTFRFCVLCLVNRQLITLLLLLLFVVAVVLEYDEDDGPFDCAIFWCWFCWLLLSLLLSIRWSLAMIVVISEIHAIG